MNTIDLKALGFTQEELQERVINRICQQVMSGSDFDEDGNECYYDSQFARKLEERIQKQIDTTINGLAEKHVLPNVASYIENLTLQQTNKWGEKVGQRVTFIEYLTLRAEAYMQETVDWDGKSKEQKDGYSWKGTQTRITYLVNSHLHHSIETAMKDALAVATGAIAKGLHETCRLKLNEIAAGLQVSVKTK